MFDSVLVANRGEIAVRIMRTLRRLGIRAIAVYSDVDADALHVRTADIARRIGPPSAVDSYLSIARIIEAAQQTGAQAIHPGYGFLAENAGFAKSCGSAGLTFIGPSPDVIELMGDKIQAKQLADRAGIPTVPGIHRPGLSDEDIIEAAAAVGFPLLLKPSAGGGGKGMRLVRDSKELPAEIAAARREARNAFADDSLLVEKHIELARHIEIQIFADNYGNTIHLGERECSLQRRHQKIIEEAPSSLLDSELRNALGQQAITLARACGYQGAGTVEFITSGATRPKSIGDFYFLEMNTRLQVEHPVTELVTGLDLVELQLRVAAGEPLPVDQQDITIRGHAMEARICAEDPHHSFVPASGSITQFRFPDRPDMRIDSGIHQQDQVSNYYDPMLAKIIAWGTNRAEAILRLDAGLANLALFGITSNISLLHYLLNDDEVVSGRLDTELVGRKIADFTKQQVPDDIFAAAVLVELLEREPAKPTGNLWEIPSGWRLSGPAWQQSRLRSGDQTMNLRTKGRGQHCVMQISESPPVTAIGKIDGEKLHIWLNDEHTSYWYQRTDNAIWLANSGNVWTVRRDDERGFAGAGTTLEHDGVIRSPMPGTVTAVNVTAGDPVAIGQSLVTVEAMKMEHRIVAPIDGLVTKVEVRPGDTVAMEKSLLVIAMQEVSNADPA